ncbi:probable acyl-[acyl-carrier-protein]--UDP-N-acetylglucosamine O-acyltransferase, mitochondrial isoform X1 [Tanacetum coccineum]
MMCLLPCPSYHPFCHLIYVGVSMDYYLQKTYYKTAPLISNSCKSIALLTGQTAEVTMLAYEYGKNLELVFQLIDDVLDFTGTSSSLEKGSLSDIRHSRSEVSGPWTECSIRRYISDDMKCSSTVLGNDCKLHPGSHVCGNTRLGDKCILMSGAIVGDNLPGKRIIGCNNVIGHHAVVGIKFQDMKYKVVRLLDLFISLSYHAGNECFLEVGDNNEIREHVSVHRSSKPYDRTERGTVIKGKPLAQPIDDLFRFVYILKRTDIVMAQL